MSRTPLIWIAVLATAMLLPAIVRAQDSDGDGMPDWWENTYFCVNAGVQDADQDPDIDGLDNMGEYNESANPCLADSDFDQMPDGWEVDNGLDPLTNDASQDPDSDSYSNLAEYQAGTDPNDPQSYPVPEISSISPDTVEAGETKTITVTGANFSAGCRPYFGEQISVSSFTNTDSSHIDATIVIGDQASAGPVEVKVLCLDPEPGFGPSYYDKLSVTRLSLSPYLTIDLPESPGNIMYGMAVAAAGDLDGDTFGDVLVSAARKDPNPAGVAFAVAGADGSTIVVFHSNDRRAGWDIASAGDQNGDGLPDIAMAAHGLLQLHSGADGDTISVESHYVIGDFEIDSIEDLNADGNKDLLLGYWETSSQDGQVLVKDIEPGVGSTIFTLDPNESETWINKFGTSVSSLSRPGIDDILVGAPTDMGPPLNYVAQGLIYVFNGSTGTLRYTVGGKYYWQYLGEAVIGMPDLDGDSVGEIVGGAPGDYEGHSSPSYLMVHSGADGSTIFEIESWEGSGSFATSVAYIEDLNGDGKDEIIAGCPQCYKPGSGEATGSVMVYSGSDASPMFRLDGARAEDAFGFDVAPAGDVDGDGKGDLIVAAPYASPGGRAVVYALDTDGDGLSDGREIVLGTDVSHPDTDRDGMADGYEDWAGLDPTVDDAAGDLDGDSLANIEEARFGSNASIIDTDADGISDFVEFKWNRWGRGLDPANNDSDGDGATDPVDNCSIPNPGQEDSDGDGIGDLCEAGGYFKKLSGEQIGDGFGSHVAGTGDVNNDGVNDFVVTAPKTDFMGTDSGSVYVISGADGSTLYRVDGDGYGTEAGREDGSAILGDLDGDGYDDFAVTFAHYSGGGYTNQGAIYFYSGIDGATLGGPLQGSSSAYTNFGREITPMGDIDGDGVPDFAAGMIPDSDFWDPNSSVFLYSGDGLGLLKRWDYAFDEEFGEFIANAGDVDGDGINDLLTSHYTLSGSGYIYHTYSGSDYSQITSGPLNFIRYLDGMGDIDGDGLSDLLVGSPFDLYVFSGYDGSTALAVDVTSNKYDSAANVGDQDGDGINDFALISSGTEVYVYSGQDGRTIDAIEMPLSETDEFTSVASPGDLDGDGRRDIVLGATDTSVGGVYVHLSGPLDMDFDGMPNDFEDISGLGRGDSADRLADADGDGFPNLQEFRMFTPADVDNTTLPDSDGDGMPDRWELHLGTGVMTSDALADPDGDGIVNIAEYENGTYPRVSNYLMQDADSDGIADFWEILNGLDPAVSDAFGDPDGDGQQNIIEYQRGSDPGSAEPAPSSFSWCASCVDVGGTLYSDTAAIAFGYSVDNPFAELILYSSYDLGIYSPSYIVPSPDVDGLGGTFSFVTGYGDGRHDFYTSAALSFVLLEAPPASPDVTVIVDRTPPAAAVAAPTPLYSDGSTVSVYFAAPDDNDADPDVDVYYRYDGGSWALVGSGSGSSGSLIFDPSDGDGLYEFYAAAEDFLGNAGDAPGPATPGQWSMTVDTAAPVAFAVNDGPVLGADADFQTDTESISANWTESAPPPASGIGHYEWALGVAAYPEAGYDSLRSFSADFIVGGGGYSSVTCNQATCPGLELADGSTYYFSVKAVSGSGVETVAVSDGVLVDAAPPAIVASSPAHREINNDAMPPVENLPVSVTIEDLGAGVDWSSLGMVLDFDTVSSYSQSGSTVSFTWGDSLNLGNHIVNVMVLDLAGNELNQNIIFALEDPRKVFINPARVEWSPGDGPVSFVADGGTGGYRWVATGGLLDSVTAESVSLAPAADPGAYVVAVSDSKLVSAQADLIVMGEVSVAPAITRLNPGDTLTFVADGGTGSFTWTAPGVTCETSGLRNEECLYTAGVEGEYTLQAEDAGGSSFTSRIVVAGSAGRAVIVVGGGLVDANRQVEALNDMGSFAYETLLARGFGKDQIYYINPDPLQQYDGDGDGYADDIDCLAGATVGCAASVDHLRYAITEWSVTDYGVDNPPVGPGVPLIVYMLDHGGADSFLVGYDESGSPETLSATSVDSWLDMVQAGGSAEVLFVYDACFSGSFIGEVGGGGPDRIFVSSASDTESAMFNLGGSVSFSRFFWQRAGSGESVAGSFGMAGLALASWSAQTPWLDDNGTGAYESDGAGKDGSAAEDFYIGADFVSSALLPEVVSQGDTVLDSDTLDPGWSAVTVWADVLYAQPSEVAAVFAIITPPGYSPPGSSGGFDTPRLVDASGAPVPRVYLEYGATAGAWSHEFTKGEVTALFPVSGRYTATYYAMDSSGNVSGADESLLIVTGPDAYEDDDVWEDASIIIAGSSVAQEHNFHDAYDEDWAMFTVGTAGNFDVFTDNLAANADTYLELYGPWPGDTSGPGALIASNDDSGGGFASRVVVWLEPGDYYVKVRQYDGAVFGLDTEYQLQVIPALPFGTLEGYVTDSSTGAGVYGAIVRVGLGGSTYLTTTTGAGGYYEFLATVPAGSGYSLIVIKPNYNTHIGTAPEVLSGQRIRADVGLVPKSGTGTITGLVTDGSSPLGGVRIVVGFAQTQSAIDGSYSLRMAPGTYTVEARAEGYEDYSSSGLAVSGDSVHVHDIAMAAIVVDSDGDGLGDSVEDAWCTDSLNPDSDGDGLCDGSLAVGSTCAAGEDLDESGSTGPGESDPCLADTDGDGLSDGDEDLLFGTLPYAWDSDGDHLPDGYEQAHAGDTVALDPLNGADGPADFDGDDIPNQHEFWNGTDPWTADPRPGVLASPACYYWGDADGDGSVGPGDVAMLQLEVSGSPQLYVNIIPRAYDTLDLDKDGNPGPGDKILLDAMLVGAERLTGYPSSPDLLEVNFEPGATAVAVGSTTHVEVSVRNVSGAVEHSGGFGVVFWVDPVSTGSATLLGGEGSDPGGEAGNRYDISGLSSAGGKASVVLRIDGAGTILLEAAIPSCGTYPDGRWCGETGLAGPLTIVAE